MIDVIFSKRAPTLRERDTGLPEDCRPKQLSTGGHGSTDYGDDEQGNLLDGVGINLRKFEDELKRNRLGEIAALVRTLTYGEMMELADAIWRTRQEGTVDQHSLPRMLHLWASPPADRSAVGNEADKPIEP
ncbi:MAG: hypothetical protein J2P54_00650 [Bradyrhizobiaceae bacterium]|nr:hypothetical protein [Bradyrhizobiaceae bacterium]MBO0754342.1 hypothetical protein [Bradyrhizobiaceae bacterium]